MKPFTGKLMLPFGLSSAPSIKIDLRNAIERLHMICLLRGIVKPFESGSPLSSLLI